MPPWRPEIRNLLDRASRFLGLAALLTVVLAAVAVGLAADRYLRRHLDGCAVMRCLGARSDTILAIHAGAGGTESQDWASMLLRNSGV